METLNKQLEILKKLTDARNQLSALYSLFNSSLLSAEEFRVGTVSAYEKMLDLKNTINQLSNELASLSKQDRATKLTNSTGKLKAYKRQAEEIDIEYQDSIVGYNSALKDCLVLKTNLTTEIKGLCDDFKVTVTEDTGVDLKKGYNNQIKLIKKILAGIDKLRADYNVKKNGLEAQNPNYVTMKNSVLSLIGSLEKSA